MAFVDLHEGVLAIFAERAAPATAKRDGRYRQASDRVDRLTLAAAEQERMRSLLQHMRNMRYFARHADDVREHDRAYAASPAGKERSRRYRATDKARAKKRARDKRRRDRLRIARGVVVDPRSTAQKKADRREAHRLAQARYRERLRLADAPAPSSKRVA